MKSLRTRRDPAPPKACTRTACCTDNPGAEPTAACFHPSACGCRVVSHPAHPTPGIATRFTSVPDGSQVAQEKA